MKKISYFILFLIILSLLWFKTGNLFTGKLKLLVSDKSLVVHSNSDVYAHLKVQGTNIDYPLAQHPSDDAYYLSHDVNHAETIYGAIFTEKVNKKDFKDLVTIIYGHSTLDGSMFGSLEWFEDVSFFNKNKEIEVTIKNEKIRYEIFSSYSFSSDHLFHTYGLGEKSSVLDYFKKIKQFSKDLKGNYRDVDFNTSDRLLILSTCDTKDNGRRFVVHAKEKRRSSVN